MIVIPRSLAEETLIAAEKIEEEEIGIKKMITTGVEPREVVKRGGYFWLA